MRRLIGAPSTHTQRRNIEPLAAESRQHLHGGETQMDAWDRSVFAMDPSELIVEEAVRVLDRVLSEAQVSDQARFVVERTIRVLRKNNAPIPRD